MKPNVGRIRKLRVERGWSQDQLAQLSGVDVRTIQRSERSGTASLETAKALASVLEVDIPALAPLPPEHEIRSSASLGTLGPLLAAISDALKETHHWRQHFNDLFMFRGFFLRKPDPPIFQPLELQAHRAAEVSLRLHQDVKESVAQLKRLDYEVQSFGGHIRSLSGIGYHISPSVQHEGAAIGNQLCDQAEFHLIRAKKELCEHLRVGPAA